VEPEVLGKVFEQVPGLSVLVWIVFKFLAHQDQTAQRNATMFDKITNSLENNTRALGQNSVTLERAIKHLEER
jgi:hypothetical protein